MSTKETGHSRQMDKALFDFYGKPWFGQAMPLAIQHVLAMIVGCVTPSIIVAGVAGLSQQDSVILIQAALVMSALTTLLQLFPFIKTKWFAIGSGLPVMMGISFAYVPSMQAIAEGYGISSILGAQIIGGIVVCLLIISFSVTLTLNFRPLYYADIQNLHITELSGREEKDIRSNYDALIDYNSLFNHQPLKFPTCAMSESGRIHFEEVKKIFDFFGWLFVGTLLLTAAAAFYFIKKHAWLWLRIAGILCIALPAFLGLMVAVNWDYVFVTFHQLVFNIGYLTLPRIRLLIFCRMDILCIVPS